MHRLTEFVNLNEFFSNFSLTVYQNRTVCKLGFSESISKQNTSKYFKIFSRQPIELKIFLMIDKLFIICWVMFLLIYIYFSLNFSQFCKKKKKVIELLSVISHRAPKVYNISWIFHTFYVAHVPTSQLQKKGHNMLITFE